MTIASQHSGALMRQAFELARQGDLERAGLLCGEVLKHDTEHADAWLLHAVMAIQSGRAADAAAAARRSLRSDPTRAAVHALLGDALLMSHQPQQALDSYQAALLRDRGLVSAHLGRGNALLALQSPQQALVSYDEVLRRRPDDAEAWFRRGNALFELKQWANAAASYDRAIARQPSHAAALSNRGSALLWLRQTRAALASFDAALMIEPAFAEAHHHRGQALRRLGAAQDALQAFDQALAARPDYAEALIGRGEVLLPLGRAGEALANFERAAALRPADAAARRGIGDALLDLGRPAQALAAHQAALRLGVGLPDVHNSVGNSLRALGRCAEAVAAYDESLRLDAGDATVHSNRAHALMHLEGHGEAAVQSFTRALQLDPDMPFAAGSLCYAQICRADWSIPVPAASREQILASVRSGNPACLPFAFLSISDCAASQLGCARVFAQRRCGIDAPGHRPSIHRHVRRRVAYVSADLREHALAYLIVGALERHDRERFETYGIALSPGEPGPTGMRVAAAFDRFIDVSAMTDAATAELMRDLEIDIAVDLNGYTQGSRPQIFAHGAAPIQVSYLGYPGTMGAPFMDYLLADDFVIPPEQRRHYSEAVVCMPDCFQANDDRRVISGRIFTRSDVGLAEDAFVFCCLNNTHKINPPLFGLWMRLLAQLPQSVLWLLGPDIATRDNLCREAANRGIDPQRLVFAGRLPYAEHLARLKLADLFLDTVPFNAGTTASDALWAGVPVLTLSGEAFAARMAGSLLRAAGMQELITFCAADYENKALELARSPQALKRLRSHLAQNRGSLPLFDTARFTAHLEAAYDEMWMRLERGESPAGFSVGNRRSNGPTNGS
jgi:predicted O-linked N-acetylglucosamine transferase (SPINDLY family)